MYNVRGLTSHINGGTLAAYIPNVSAAIMTPSLYLKAITEVPVTMGSLNTINYVFTHKQPITYCVRVWGWTYCTTFFTGAFKLNLASSCEGKYPGVLNPRGCIIILVICVLLKEKSEVDEGLMWI